jgi:hypothetical protein
MEPVGRFGDGVELREDADGPEKRLESPSGEKAARGQRTDRELLTEHEAGAERDDAETEDLTR